MEIADIEKKMNFNRSLFLSLPPSEEKLTTVAVTSAKLNCTLLVGCLRRIIMWDVSDLSIEWMSQVLDEQATLTHLALLEPADDPKPYCYLWAALEYNSEPASPELFMFAMLFKEKVPRIGGYAYVDLESKPSLKTSLLLNETDRVVQLQALEQKEGDSSLLFVGTEEGCILFDINQWYREHMPPLVGSCANPNAILASYPKQQQREARVLSSLCMGALMCDFRGHHPNPREELFFPNSLSFSWMELDSERLVHWETRGAQRDLLRELEESGPVVFQHPTEWFLR